MEIPGKKGRAGGSDGEIHPVMTGTNSEQGSEGQSTGCGTRGCPPCHPSLCHCSHPPSPSLWHPQSLAQGMVCSPGAGILHPIPASFPESGTGQALLPRSWNSASHPCLIPRAWHKASSPPQGKTCSPDLALIHPHCCSSRPGSPWRAEFLQEFPHQARGSSSPDPSMIPPGQHCWALLLQLLPSSKFPILHS